ncbi:TIGR01777 family protein [Corynebacterium yudongzhengii]|uniref:TIGR01777 family protein n=1 Tax=Corynebacterium yudongzhengii TaxID=2080740 RepID=A0A2U1T7P5_9CORY|nr:TIGR01777 family oxidoreductase [Corynebacterium yudongzhengii]AWB81827.1 TIGR01777 family protein [Corynebacterium yudongzhengii]PWC02003.1 TIGR01777 family protein [Corynebacterium yudongzhengii]
MSLHARHTLAHDRTTVWDYHTRPGALTRLTPPFLPMTPTRQTQSLRDGTSIFSLPAGLRWEARHLPEHYEEYVSFADQVVNAPLRQIANWTHIHSFADTDDGGTEITDRVDTRAPANLLHPAWAYRQQQLIGDLAAHDRLRAYGEKNVTVALTGSHGTVGRALKALLTTAGHTVIPLVRGEAGEGERHWDTDHPAHNLLDGVDVLVHLAGEPLFGRFNDSHKAEVYSSRVGPTRRLAELVGRVDTCQALVCASAIGIYGADRGDEVLTEDSERGEGFLADVVADWEHATLPAKEAGKRVVNVRTGVAMAGDGGMLPLLSTLFATGLGGRIGDGQMWMSWIAIDDLTDIYATAVLDDTLNGLVNAVAPEPVRNVALTRALGSTLNRPTLLPVPGFGPAILLGREGAEELALANQRVAARVLNERGHHFRYRVIDDAFAHELGREQLQH